MDVLSRGAAESITFLPSTSFLLGQLFMSIRDEFRASTKALLAKRVGYLCSHPDCYRPTIGPALGDDRAVNLGEAAHITAAAAEGPRYDPSLTSEQRRDYSNGIWMCAYHAKQVDSDEKHFTVPMLWQWKEDAEKNAFSALTNGRLSGQRLTIKIDIEPDILARLGFGTDEDVDTLAARLQAAARSDIEAFKREPRWPSHPIELNLRLDGTDAPAFGVERCAAGLIASRELSIIAPPGAGKSTTLVQLAEAILVDGERVAVVVPLNEWSGQVESLLASLAHHAAFRTFRERDFMLLAIHGRLSLLLDGWNELDSATIRKATTEISRLKRDFPLLEVAISTRRRAISAPLSGPHILIEGLSEEQQLRFARATAGERGETLLDHAWRIAGLRELVSIPLYLNALLKHAPGGTMPTTREEVLRLFIAEHERSTENAELFRAQLQDTQRELMVALAVHATATANTVISESQSRSVISEVSRRLAGEGQISGTLQPPAVLDALVDHHVLVRTGSERNLLFQHQQFQEWFASVEVESLMLASFAGDLAIKRRLQVSILNVPTWEEPVLFACERLSRTNSTGVRAVAAAIMASLSIDPMLAAEMIYRSSPDVWTHLRDAVAPLAIAWHSEGRVDRAVRFMILTGRKDFASQVWPLVSSTDSQIYLPALRASDRFRPSVLGDSVQERLASLPDEVREHVVSVIAIESGMDGMELAAEVAKTDPNPKVQLAVIQALSFRRADRLIREVLKVAHQATWTLLAKAGYADEISDPEISTRLSREEQLLQENDPNPLRRLGVLLKSAECPQVLAEIEELVASPNFPTKGHIGSLAEVTGPFFAAIVAGLRRRLVHALPVPFDCEQILMQAPLIDEGPIVAVASNLASPRGVAEAAAVSLGPKAVGDLVDKFITLSGELRTQHGRRTEAQSDQYYRLRDIILRTRTIPFVEAWLARADTSDVETIAILSSLLAGHGCDVTETSELPLDESLSSCVATTCIRHGESLLASREATRHQLAELARAIRRVPSSALTNIAIRLAEADLARWRRVRDERAKDRTGSGDWSDAAMCYTGEHTRALAAIGDETAIRFLEAGLADLLFGRDAAIGLRQIWNKQQGPVRAPMKLGHDLSVIKDRREQRRIGYQKASAIGDAIFDAVEQLAKPDRSEREQLHALQLATIALQLPYGDKAKLIETLIELPVQISAKRDLLIALALAGEVVSADLALDGVRDLVEAAKEKPWRLQESNKWEINDWLMLLPLTDRPASLLDGLDALPKHLHSPWEMRRALSALAAVPSLEAEQVLGELARRDPRFFREYEWLDAILKQEQVSSYLMLFDLLCEVQRNSHKLDRWDLAEKVAVAITRHPDLRAALLQRYQNPMYTNCHWLIEQVISKNPDEDSVLALVSVYAAQQRPFDMLLHRAITEVASERRAVPGWEGSYQQHSVAVNRLRKQLFAMTENEGPGKEVAVACLTTIDEVRDEYGYADSELRHPDIDAGRPWPNFRQVAR